MIFLGLFVYVQRPYRSKPLYTQKYDYNGVKYDLDKANFLRQTENILKINGFRAEQGMIVAYKNPGLVYLMKSYHPGGILWSEKTENSYFLMLSKFHCKQKPAVVSINKDISPKFVDKLNAATQWDFYKDYHLVQPYRYYETGGYVYIYLPN